MAWSYHPRLVSVRLKLLLTGMASLMGALGGFAQEDANRGGLAGPLPLRIISPTQILFFQFSPERAACLGKGVWNGRFEFSETNVILDPLLPPQEFVTNIDTEISRFNFGLRYGLTDRWDLGAELPILYMHGGFMDSFIKDVEGFFDKPKRRRQQEIPDSFTYDVSRNGTTFLRRDDNRITLGDLAFTAKRKLLEQRRCWPALAARAALKVPTGDEDQASGSGRLDVALGLASEWDFSRWGITMNLNSTFPVGNRFDSAGLETQPIVSGMVEGEYRFSPRYSVHLQFAGTMSPFNLDEDRGPTPFSTLNSEGVTGEILQATVGFAWRPRPSVTLFLGAVEDFPITDKTAADFTFFLALDYRFGM